MSNLPTIESKEYQNRVNFLRAEMEKRGVDIVVGFSNCNCTLLLWICTCKRKLCNHNTFKW